MIDSSMVDLSRFNNRGFDRGRSCIVESLWRITSATVFQSGIVPFYGLKRLLLRAFGATIGRSVLIKPRVTVTFPWKLTIGDYSWVGEGVWLDNLDRIEIGSNVCISQRAHLLTGSHNATSATFDLITRPIVVEDGAWIGAGAMIAPGVRLGSLCFVTMGGVVTKDVAARTVVGGNPAEFVRDRAISAS